MIQFDVYDSDYFVGDVKSAFHNKLCTFEIVKVEDGFSQAGRPMLNLEIKIESSGNRHKIKEKAVLVGNTFKLYQILAATGYEHEAKTGSFDERKLIGCKGELVTIVEPYEKDGKFYDNVKVESYMLKTEPVKKKDTSHTSPYFDALAKNPELNDDIPF
jgi:hypothetical protein